MADASSDTHTHVFLGMGHQRNERRTWMVIGLCAGVVIAAGTAVSVGALLVHLRYGAVDLAAVPVSHGHPVYYFTEAPPVFLGRNGWQIACTLLLPASTAALVYAVPVAATARDDLGGYPAVDAVYPRPAGASPTPL